MPAFLKRIGQLIGGKLGSVEKATLIVRFFRTMYASMATAIVLIWYTAWRNERVAPGEIKFPFINARLKRRFRPDRPNTDHDLGYRGDKNAMATVSGGGGGGLNISGSGAAGPPDWGGAKAVAAGLLEGISLQWTSTKRSTKSTSSGGVSDHWQGCRECYAIDASGSVAHMDQAARMIMSRLGAHYSGGELVHTVERGGFRIQILYRTYVGGDHYDHIHIGVRKVGYEP